MPVSNVTRPLACGQITPLADNPLNDSVPRSVYDKLAMVPQQPQVQCSVTAQLAALAVIANRFGLYDAADHVNDTLGIERRQTRSSN